MDKITVELDKRRSIRFDINALAAFDEVNKKSLEQCLIDEDFNFASIRNLIWCGLLHEDEELTPKRAGELISAHWIDKGKTIQGLIEYLQEGLRQGGVIAGDDSKKKPQKKVAASKTQSKNTKQ